MLPFELRAMGCRMPMYWRRVVCITALFWAASAAAWVTFRLGGSWYVAIGCAVLVFALTPLIFLARIILMTSGVLAVRGEVFGTEQLDMIIKRAIAAPMGRLELSKAEEFLLAELERNRFSARLKSI